MPQKYNLNAINEMMKDGHLTEDEADALLMQLIQQEELKSYDQQDFSKLAAYEKMLFELRSGRPLATRKEEGRKKLDKYLSEHPVKKRSFQPVYRMVIVLASMALLVAAIEVIFPLEWLHGNPSNDQQQYIIQGESIDPQVIAQGKADENTSDDSITTTNLDEAINLLGYTPQYPRWIPEGWKILQIDAKRSKMTDYISIAYSIISTDQILRYDEIRFKDADQAIIEFEQNGIGKKMNVAGQDVYMTMNTDAPVCIWQVGLINRSVFGPLSEEDIIKIVASVR